MGPFFCHRSTSRWSPACRAGAGRGATIRAARPSPSGTASAAATVLPSASPVLKELKGSYAPCPTAIGYRPGCSSHEGFGTRSERAAEVPVTIPRSARQAAIFSSLMRVSKNDALPPIGSLMQTFFSTGSTRNTAFAQRPAARRFSPGIRCPSISVSDAP